MFKSENEYCNEKSIFYVQVPCVMPRRHYYGRQVIGLVVGCIGTFIYLFSLNFLEYMAGM